MGVAIEILFIARDTSYFVAEVFIDYFTELLASYSDL